MRTLRTLSALYLLLPMLANAQFTGGIGRGDVRRSYIPHRINTQAVASPICAGSSISVPYELVGLYTLFMNTFTVQLSNASGSFLSPTTIGSVSSVNSGTIACIIPPGTPGGTGYRIRVVSSSPAVIGTDNGSDLAINAPPGATIAYAASPYCSNGGTATVDRTGTAGGTYTASPAGLSITSTTGAVDLGASTAGTYTVTYTIAASGGCAQLQSTASITVNAAPSATIATIQDPLCQGEQSGSIDMDLDGGTPPITYTWSNGAQVQDPTGLGAGEYTVVVTDQFGCEVSASATLTDPPALLLSATVTNETLGNDGAIDLQVSGGTPPYTYVWSNGSSGQDLDGLVGGAYSVEVTDANGCPVTLQVVVVSTVGLDELELGPEWTLALDGGAQLLTVSADMPFKAVELLDASGRVILSKQELSLVASMGVGHLSSGVYFVRLSFDEGPSLKRLFIGW